MQSFVEHASHSQEAVRTAKRSCFPEGLVGGGGGELQREEGREPGGGYVALLRLKRLCLRRGAPSIWLFGKDKVLLLMKSRFDIWELGDRWDAPSSGSLILAPALTIHGLVSYAREWGEMSYSRKCFSPFAACCRRGAVIGIICIDKLSSGMINNHLFQSLSAVCICQHACAGYRYSRKFYANMRVSFLFNFPPPLIPFKSRNKTLKKKKEKNKQKMKNTAFFFGAVFNA